MTEIPTNTQLAAVMTEAGMSRKGLARRVADISRNRGDRPPASPDHNRVRRWVMTGEVPKASTQRCIALALQDKLGRRVTPQEIGFTADEDKLDLDEDGAKYPEHVSKSVALLTALTSTDDNDEVAGPDWTSGPTSSVITDYLLGQSLVVATEFPFGGDRRLAAPIRDTTASFMKLDFQYGGGYMRSLLENFFKTNVAPLLNRHFPETERRDLFSAAAEVAQLLGWTNYDAGRHREAQRYLIQGLRLAKEAGDHMLGGRLLSNLSHQANYLGAYNDAVRYARAAQQATLNFATPTVTALYLAHEARALASLGDSRGCAAVIDRAESTFDASRPESEPAWASYVDSAEIASEWAHCFRDLGEPRNAVSFMEQAIQEVPPRTQAFMRMVGAQSVLQEGSLDEAVSMAKQAIDLAGPLDSARYQRYLVDFQSSAAVAYPDEQKVQDFSMKLQEQFPTIELA